MIPMVLARHIQSGLADYVETTFPMTNKPFRGSIRKLAHQEGMLSQEPFVSVKLPFRVVGKHVEFPSRACTPRTGHMRTRCAHSNASPPVNPHWWPPAPVQARPNVSCTQSSTTATGSADLGARASKPSSSTR